MAKTLSRAFGFLIVAAMSVAAAAQEPQVTIADGSLAGTSADGVESFKAIPFAAPPVGPLRWRAPQPVQPWKSLRPATDYAPACMQDPVPGIAAPIEGPLSEDCLYLNVWRPAGSKPGARLPVMVWIHGGGFVNGGATPAIFRGDAFARQGVIMVSIPYRLGRFGFFAHPALSAADEDGGLRGNYGLLDQIAALRWVQQNIAAFGGDPSRVTIFGESAGGASVHMLLASPLAKGLFAQGIVQSGGGRGSLLGDRYLDRDNGPLISMERAGRAFAVGKGIIGDGDQALARLRALRADELVGNLNMRTMVMHLATFAGPAIDGRIVTAAPDAIYRSGGQARVPLIIGATSADLGLVFAMTKDGLFGRFGAQAETLRNAYDPDGTTPLPKLLAAVAGDVTMGEPARYVAELFERQGLPAWNFRFSYVADSVRGKFPAGAPHASDIPYVMDTVNLRYGAATTARDAGMARVVNQYWINFAKTGNPNGTGLPDWPRHAPDKDMIMDFSAEGRAVPGPDPRKAKYDAIAAAAEAERLKAKE